MITVLSRFNIIVMLITMLFYGSVVAGNQQPNSNNYDIWEYEVDGNTLLDKDEIQRTLYPHLGPSKSISDIELARKNLEDLYRANGYPTVIVNIPPQKVEHALVTLRVIEGKVERLKVSGSRYYSLSQIKKDLPVLHKGSIPYLPSLREQVSSLNRGMPDRYVNPVMRPGRQLGTIDVELKVKDSLPFHGHLELNNKHSESTSELRSELSFSFDNLWQKGHSLSFAFQTTPENHNELKVYSGNYLMRWRRSDAKTAMYIFSTTSDVTTSGDVTVLGKGKVSGLRHIIPFSSQYGHARNVKIGFDYKDFDDNIGLRSEDLAIIDQLGIQTTISYFVLSANYSDSFTSELTRTYFDFGVNYSTRGFGNTLQEFSNKRYKANPNFYYLKANGVYESSLIFNTKFRFKSQAQFTHQALISNEQFTVGGFDTVRGYLSSSASAERGLLTNFEVESANLGRYMSLPAHNLNFLVFSDIARLWRLHTLPNEPKRFFLLSSGFALNYDYKNRIKANLAVASPLWDSTISKKITLREPQIHFTLRAGF